MLAFSVSDDEALLSVAPSGPEDPSRQPPERSRGWTIARVWGVLLASLAAVVLPVVAVRNCFPSPAGRSAAPGSFSEARARIHLEAITAKGHAVRWGGYDYELGGNWYEPDDGNLEVFGYIERYLRSLGTAPRVQVRGRRPRFKPTLEESVGVEVGGNASEPSPGTLPIGSLGLGEGEGSFHSDQSCATERSHSCRASIMKNGTAFNYVAARIKGTRGKGKNALLMACHMDSRATQFLDWGYAKDLWPPLVESGKLVRDETSISRGAADDGEACSQLLEVARAFVHAPPQADVIVLFANGEEEGHVGAHRFVQDDPWYKEVGTLVEQDQGASRGIAFVTFGESLALAQAYASDAPYPRASSTYQDFDDWRNLNTDGVLFRMLGVPTITLLQMEDRCGYHTQYDTIDRVPAGTLQANGENMLSVARKIADNEALLQMKSTIVATYHQLHESDRAVTFDLLSGLLVVYSWPTARVLNSVASVLALALAAQQIWSEYLATPISSEEGSPKVHDRSFGRVLAQAFTVFSVTLLAYVLATVCPLLQAKLLLAAGKEGTWYQRDAFAFWLYGAPALLGATAPYLLLRSRCCGSLLDIGDRSLERLSGIAVVLLLAIVTMVLTGIGFRCGYLWMLLMLGRAIGMGAHSVLDELQGRGALSMHLDFWWVEIVALVPPAVLWLDTLRFLLLNVSQSMGSAGGLLSQPELDVACFGALSWQAAVPCAVFLLRAGTGWLSVGALAIFNVVVFLTALALPVRDIYPCAIPGLV